MCELYVVFALSLCVSCMLYLCDHCVCELFLILYCVESLCVSYMYLCVSCMLYLCGHCVCELFLMLYCVESLCVSYMLYGAFVCFSSKPL